jgi:ketosteroid isomerase-like protein
MNIELTTRLRHILADLTGIVEHQEATGFSSDDPDVTARRVVEELVAAIDAGDLDGIGRHLHHDAIYIVSGRSRIAGMYEGIESIRTAFTIPPRAGAVDLTSKLTRLIAGPDGVATFHEISGTIEGRPFSFETALRYHLRDGLIDEIHEYSADQHTSDDLFR